MKKLFTLLLCFVCFAHAQNNLSFDELKSMTERPRGKIVSYVASNGETYLLEDKIVFPPTPLDAKHYSGITQNGFVIRENVAGTNTHITSFQLRTKKERGFYVIANCRSSRDFFEIDIEKAIEEDIFNHSEMVRRRDTTKSITEEVNPRVSLTELEMTKKYLRLAGKNYDAALIVSIVSVPFAVGLALIPAVPAAVIVGSTAQLVSLILQFNGNANLIKSGQIHKDNNPGPPKTGTRVGTQTQFK